MQIRPLAAFVLGLASALLLAATFGQTSSPPSPQGQDDMQAMMQKAKKFTQPGERHKLLIRLLGKWDMATSFVMGGKRSPETKGTAEGRWLMDGRWLTLEGNGTLMGMPSHTFWVIGHDNFKQSYVAATVNTMDTAMLHSEGKATQDGKAIVTYGPMDEYLTGEVGKTVKYVFRFVTDDKFVLEVHDMAIGETDTLVVETVFTRAGK